MRKYKNRYHENTRVVRINLGLYEVLRELAARDGSSIDAVLE
jgi:hypothetical protein